MDDMERLKNAKISLHRKKSIPEQAALESTCSVNGNAILGFNEVPISTSTPATSSSINVVKDTNETILSESIDEKINLEEKNSAEKFEESPVANAGGAPPPIGVPLARSSPISREFLALQRSLNESKILTEFVTDITGVKAARKGRKSGLAAAINSKSRENSLIKVSNRLRGDPLDLSNEDLCIAKRSNMRSQNSEFAQRHMDFLNRVIQQQQSGDEQYGSEIDDVDRYNVNTADDDDERHTNVSNSSAISSDLSLQDLTSLETRLKEIWQPPPKRGWDSFCWRCRESGPSLIPCSKCLRSFHKHCVKVSSSTKLDNSWNCPECLAVENALSSPKKARRPELTIDMLSELLSFALKRMRSLKGNSKFVFADNDLSSFSKYIVNPVTFASMEEKIAKKAFRCPEEFYNETKWMVHNAHILTAGVPNCKMVATAKSVLKVCRQEANEIETCSGCYLSANTRSDWFVDVCAQPHLLLWAKLKGFPYWPAKAMGVGQNAVVNVRFFGKHDRAFVPIKDCFLFSEQDPNTQTGKRSARELADCIKEVEIHIKKIEAKVGKFNYAPFKTPYDPTEEQQQLELMMPGVSQYMKRQQVIVLKPSLQYKIVKTADNNLSIIKKPNSGESGNDEVETSPELSEGLRKETNKSSTSSDSSKHTTSKYEVITKTVSSDSNSPKLSTVILKKRKSISFQNTNADVDDKNIIESEAVSPKILKTAHVTSTATKISNKNELEPSGSVLKPTRTEAKSAPAGATVNILHSGKRKQDAAELVQNEDNDGCGEKHKAKHSRSEPRLPILTIRAGSAKIVETSAREVAENFAKSNTCVTIKKISKPTTEETETTAESNSTSIRATRSAIKDTEVVSSSTAQNTMKEKNTSTTSTATHKTVTAKGTIAVSTTNETNSSTSSKISQSKTDKGKKGQNDRDIFRELVPFVEIKQEVNSDEETPISAPSVVETPALSATTTTQISTPISSSVVTPLQQNKDDNGEPLLTKVKEEAVSDDETMSTNKNSSPKDVQLNSSNEPPVRNLSISSTQAPVAGNSLSDGAIRVVGDTTIQRVSTRNAAIAVTAAPQNAVLVTQTSTTATTLVPTSSPNTGLNVANTTSSKRCTSRTGGVPYGPLPASATSVTTNLLPVTSSKVTITENSIQPPQNLLQQQPQQQQLQQQMQHVQTQRARKSFPNRSPPMSVMPTFPTVAAGSVGNVQNSGISAPIATNTVSEAKRGGSLKSTSMVSIPADVAAQRNITQNTIPMPPLTAVSKTTPMIASVTNSIVASNSPSSSPNSSASLIGTIVPAAFANTGYTNINKTNSNSTQQGSTISMATTNQGQKLTAPPPLAGLSYTNANTATSSSGVPLQPAVLPAANNSVLPGANTSLSSGNVDSNGPNAAENHLLGDFVTPALANAITEVICRGPPKMARRPNGPLQSDGSTMFPSGAGPVCRTLVQNAHKLTDFFISVMEDTMCDMSNSDEPSLEAKITLLTMELERLKQAHEQEIAELKRTSDLMLCEMRKSMENEKTRIANEIRKQCEFERLRCVEEAKRKQWCANCGREAQFYCCWNTSYCDYPCQQQHWGRHASTCAQTRCNDTPSTITSSAIGNSQPTLSGASTISTHAFNSEMRNKPSSMNAGSMNINIHYSKNVSSSKKDKQINSAPSSSMTSSNKNSANIALPLTNPVASDTLKLPSNTYLRPVASNTNGPNTNNTSSLRSSGFTSTAPSRYNVALPPKPSANSATPYTIVQRGNSWELLTTSSHNSIPMNSVNTINTLAGVQSANSTVPSLSNTHPHSHPNQQPIHHQHQQQQRSATMPNIINNKVSGRNRGGVSIVTSNSNGNMRATKM